MSNDKIEWQQLAGQKRQWGVGMVEATFAVGRDETMSLITHESVTGKVVKALEASFRPDDCTWTPEDDDSMPDTWSSACGQMWSFIDGGPEENRVSYCHHCGGKVIKGASL